MVVPDPADPACEGVVHADRVAASLVNRLGGERTGGADHDGTQIGVLHQRLDIDLAHDLGDVDLGHEPIHIQLVDYLVEIHSPQHDIQVNLGDQRVHVQRFDHEIDHALRDALRD